MLHGTILQLNSGVSITCTELWELPALKPDARDCLNSNSAADYLLYFSFPSNGLSFSSLVRSSLKQRNWRAYSLFPPNAYITFLADYARASSGNDQNKPGPKFKEHIATDVFTVDSWS